MVTFYIRKPPEGLERIYVRITVRRGMQFRFFTGWVLPLNARWDNQRGRIGTSRRTDFKMLNAQLARMGEYIERKDMLALSSNRIRDKEFYRSVLNEFKGVQATNKEETPGTLEQEFQRFISFYGGTMLPIAERLSPGTLKTYKTCLSHLQGTLHGDVALRDIDMNWYRSFVKRAELGGREKAGLSKNYIGKLVKLVKRVLRFAESRGEQVHPAFKTRAFKVLTEEVSSVYLTESEIERVRRLELAPGSSLGITRDLFVVGCYTGLRYSDFSKLSQDHIREYQGVRMFEVRSQKTDERVSIPIHPVVEEIMASRNGRLPSFQNDQLMNRNLKRIGLMAELDGMEEVERTEGGLRQSKFKPKYELLQTHTARRSFCTNAYIKGLDTLDIMAISGHKTESNFLRYIKVTREQRAKRIAQHPFFAS